MSRVQIGGLVAVSIACVIGATVNAWVQHQPTSTAPIVVEPVTAPSASAPAVSTVHCVHEVCGERPRYLRCTSMPYAGICSIYEISYEHHCNCDRWAE